MGWVVGRKEGTKEQNAEEGQKEGGREIKKREVGEVERDTPLNHIQYWHIQYLLLFLSIHYC